MAETVLNLFLTIIKVKVRNGNVPVNNSNTIDETKECLAEREGFEPSIRCRIHTFQACAFSHSATSPKVLSGKLYPRIRVITKGILKGISRSEVTLLNQPTLYRISIQIPTFIAQKRSSISLSYVHYNLIDKNSAGSFFNVQSISRQRPITPKICG